jgi:hypothetical protein
MEQLKQAAEQQKQVAGAAIDGAPVDPATANVITDAAPTA